MSSVFMFTTALRVLAAALLVASAFGGSAHAGNSVGNLIGNAAKPRVAQPPAPAAAPTPAQASTSPQARSAAAAGEARNLECLAALAVVGVDMQKRGDPAVQGVIQAVSLWKGRTEHIRMADAGEYGTRMQQQLGLAQVRSIAEQCQREVNRMNAGDCARYANAIGEELEWRLKWAGNQAVIGAASNGSMQYAQDHIRQGCTMSDTGLRRMREVGCDARLIEQVQSWRTVFRLDMPNGNHFGCDRY